MSKYQGQTAEVPVRLLDNAGAAVTGVLFSDVTLRVRKAGAGGFVTRAVTSPDWIELGFGIYVLILSPADMDTLGAYVYYLTGAAFRPNWATFDVAPVPLSFLAAPPLCLVTGNVVDLAGRAMTDSNQNLVISFRIAQVPQQTGGSLITSKLITTAVDALGNFSVPLLRGAVVLVQVDPLGLKQEFTVPNVNTATLLSLLPPI